MIDIRWYSKNKTNTIIKITKQVITKVSGYFNKLTNECRHMIKSSEKFRMLLKFIKGSTLITKECQWQSA